MADVEPMESRAGGLLAAATALFAGDGYDGIPLRTLATASGLAVAPIDCHCGSKRDRYDAVLGRAAKREHVLIPAHSGNLQRLCASFPRCCSNLSIRSLMPSSICLCPTLNCAVFGCGVGWSKMAR